MHNLQYGSIAGEQISQRVDINALCLQKAEEIGLLQAALEALQAIAIIGHSHAVHFHGCCLVGRGGVEADMPGQSAVKAVFLRGLDNCFIIAAVMIGQCAHNVTIKFFL